MAVPRRAEPERNDEFYALDRGLRCHPQTNIPAQIPPERDRTGRDAFAIHGRLGARVALPQSPVFPNAHKKYQRKLENQLQKELNHSRQGWVSLK